MFLKTYNFFKASIRWILLAILVVSVVLSALYGGPSNGFRYFMNGIDRRLLVLGLVVVVIAGLVLTIKFVDWLLRKTKLKIPPIAHWVLVVIASATLLIAQFHFIKQYSFYSGWDAGTVRLSVEHFKNGEQLSNVWREYYDIYDNNRTITSVFLSVVRFMDKFHIVYDDFNNVFILMQIIVYMVASLALFALARKATGRYLYAWLAWLLLLALIGVSPWLSVPYTDCMTMAFAIVALWVFSLRVVSWWATGIKYLTLAVIIAVAINFKPQSAIMVIAIIGYLVMLLVKNKFRLTRLQLINTAVGSVSFVLALVVGLLVVDKMNDHYVPIDKGHSMPWTHFVMMGLNTETYGMFLGTDVLQVSLQNQFHAVGTEFIRDQKTKLTTEQIKEINIAEIKRRLHKLGVKGLINQIKNKSINNFSDGTFGWFGEGSFDQVVPDRRGQPGNWLRATYYYPEPKGKYSRQAFNFFTGTSHFHDFRNIERIIWWAIVLLAAVAGFVWRKKDSIMMPAMLAVIGICLFELIFESRSRYFITMTPVFVLLATIGVAGLVSWRKPSRFHYHRDSSTFTIK